MERIKVIVQYSNRYMVLEVMGFVPENFVCNAPADPTQLHAIEQEQAEGGQDLISAFVNSQKGQL